MQDIYMVKKSTNVHDVLRAIRSSGGAEGVLDEAGRTEQHIIPEAAPNELTLGSGAGSDEVGHRQGGGVMGCSSGVVCKSHLIGSGFSEGMRTHPHPRFEYPLGKPLEAKLLH